MSAFGRVIQLLPSSRNRNAIAAERTLSVPLPVVRRVSFASLSGGTGCTTVATRMASIFSARRSGRVLFVAAADTDIRPPLPGSAQERSIPVPVWPNGIDNWRTVCAGEETTPELIVTDWGAVGAAELRAIAAHAHVLCLTTAVERTALQRTLDIASTLTAAGTPTAIVSSAVRGRAGAAVRAMLASSPVPLFPLPFDASVRTTSSRPAPIGGATSYASTLLAAGVIHLLSPSFSQGGTA